MTAIDATRAGTEGQGRNRGFPCANRKTILSSRLVRNGCSQRTTATCHDIRESPAEVRPRESATRIRRVKPGVGDARSARSGVTSSRRAAWVIAAFVCLSLFVQAMIIFVPKVDSPRDVDVVVVLAPWTLRVDEGLALIHAGHSFTLLLSAPEGSAQCSDAIDRLSADDRHDGVTVICFAPDPATTAGEAATFAELAATQGWESATVVTDRVHLSRARLHFQLCAPQLDLSFAMAERHHSPAAYVGRFFYESGARVKAAFGEPLCATVNAQP